MFHTFTVDPLGCVVHFLVHNYFEFSRNVVCLCISCFFTFKRYRGLSISSKTMLFYNPIQREEKQLVQGLGCVPCYDSKRGKAVGYEQRLGLRMLLLVQMKELSGSSMFVRRVALHSSY